MPSCGSSPLDIEGIDRTDKHGLHAKRSHTMVFTSYRIESLRKAEESLFASGLAWWRAW